MMEEIQLNSLGLIDNHMFEWCFWCFSSQDVRRKIGTSELNGYVSFQGVHTLMWKMQMSDFDSKHCKGSAFLLPFTWLSGQFVVRWGWCISWHLAGDRVSNFHPKINGYLLGPWQSLGASSSAKTGVKSQELLKRPWESRKNPYHFQVDDTLMCDQVVLC